MKKIIAFLLAVLFVLGCVACTGEQPPQNSSSKPVENPGSNLDGDQNDDQGGNKNQEDNKIMLDMPTVRPKPKDPVGDIGKQPREIEALLAVARAYVARTTATQYEDSKMTSAGDYWFIKQKDVNVNPLLYSPESASSQHTYYSSCAVFIKDIFLTAWGVEVVQPVTVTSAQLAHDKNYGFWKYYPTGKETAEEKEKIKKEFFDILQPGDVITTCKSGASGHIMIYVGNGWMIHSTNYKALGGGDYDQTNNAPKLEVNGSVEYYDMTLIFEPNQKYDFWAYEVWSILRPISYLDNVEITEQTQLRMENLVDIYVEKISSHPVGITAVIGEEITYGFYVRNDRNETATVELKDVVPENTTYVSGAWELDGNNMSWSITLAPGEEKMICYTVKVNEDPSLYNNGVIVSDKGTAGGVIIPCNNVYVMKKLDAETIAKIERAADSVIKLGRKDTALVETIYQKAGIEIDLPLVADLAASIFTTSGPKLNKNSEYYNLIIPTLYGGYTKNGNDTQKGDRNQFIDYELMAGDVLIYKEGAGIKAYMCIGENKLVDLESLTVYEGEDYKKIAYSVYGRDVYAVLRPCAGIN